MTARPPIPAEVRRLVLVEAGHRCAIPRCLQPFVDVHHIRPWRESHEHRFEELIALCPNCHRRADAGEIDAKSLYLYKAQLSAGRASTEASSEPLIHREPGLKARWTTMRLAESAPDPGRYDLEIEFPEFGDERDLDELNTVLRAAALRHLHVYRKQLYWHDDVDQENLLGLRNLCLGSFEVCLLSPHFVSIKHSLYEYAGGAHGDTTFFADNYRREPLMRLDLGDILFVTEELLNVLSSQCAVSLMAALPEADPWGIREGVAPEARKFEIANVNANGLQITFPAYQVSCYADGPQTVLIPKEVLRPFMRPRVLDGVWT